MWIDTCTCCVSKQPYTHLLVTNLISMIFVVTTRTDMKIRLKTVETHKYHYKIFLNYAGEPHQHALMCRHTRLIAPGKIYSYFSRKYFKLSLKERYYRSFGKICKNHLTHIFTGLAITLKTETSMTHKTSARERINPRKNSFFDLRSGLHPKKFQGQNIHHLSPTSNNVKLAHSKPHV